MIRLLSFAIAILLFFLLPIATIYSAVTQHTLFVSSGIDEKMATEIPGNSSSRQSDFARQAEDETDLYFIYKTGQFRPAGDIAKG